jgi:hypothetical protein
MPGLFHPLHQLAIENTVNHQYLNHHLDMINKQLTLPHLPQIVNPFRSLILHCFHLHLNLLLRKWLLPSKHKINQVNKTLSNVELTLNEEPVPSISSSSSCCCWWACFKILAESLSSTNSSSASVLPLTYWNNQNRYTY